MTNMQYPPVSRKLARRVGIEPTDELPMYADGGYPIYYLDSDNSVLCAQCANNSRDMDEVPQFKPVDAGINWDDDNLYCEQCSLQIRSSYGDDEDNE